MFLLNVSALVAQQNLTSVFEQNSEIPIEKDIEIDLIQKALLIIVFFRNISIILADISNGYKFSFYYVKLWQRYYNYCMFSFDKMLIRYFFYNKMLIT